HEITILELAQKLIEITGSPSQLQFLPSRVDDPPRRCPDIRKAQRLLGWSPSVSLEEGLRKTVDWFKLIPKRC
ncbi:MAG: SDR family NAD-dependent epimerase/dehydratase, partial [Aquificaceae bacterium]|nr:SDR family NAD-dependent epimerase/dehydratase [Aquificaceae bacterium]